VPEEISNASADLHTRESFVEIRVVDDVAHAVIGEHLLPVVIKPLPTSKPPRRCDEYSDPRCEPKSLLDEVLIDRRSRGAVPAITELIGRVADDDVELHGLSKYLAQASLDVVSVDKRVSVSLEVVAPPVV